jgi:hypothetical protein
VREPYFNTNDDEQNWFRLAGDRGFCKFTSKKDGSRIFVELSTLYTESPTLAALAYYAEVPLNSGCNGNPASCYCSQIGGTDSSAESTPTAVGGLRSPIQSIRFSRPASSRICPPSTLGD